MGELIRIALIGFDTLESLGLRLLLNEIKGCTYERFDTFAEFEPFSEKTDGYVVSMGRFVENLDFFLPRKGRTLVAGKGDFSDSERSGVSILSCAGDESDLREGIERFVKALKGGDVPDELSGREMEVLRLIASGKINKEIADALCISVNTVITHRKNISAKLGIKSASGLSLYAMMNGII
ncbi:MAG: helix-turn-helix transcriptional regulator [Muribaculaceae bacterium]|nr:helix-turn-helix transcriptional regulator [Muribaculaceae bacterium]